MRLVGLAVMNSRDVPTVWLSLKYMFSITKLTASWDIMLDLATGIYDRLGVVYSGRVSCCSGLSRLDPWFTGASVLITGSMPGLLFHVWRICVLGAAKRFLLFIGLVDVVTSGGSSTL